jgi:hypothetical protein
MAQAVSRRPLTTEAKVRARVSQCGNVVEVGCYIILRRFLSN